MDCKLAKTSLTARVLADYRVQPMLASDTHWMRGLEVLYRRPLDLENPYAMLAVDIGAIKAARFLSDAYRHRLRIHCNVEISSMLNLDWIVAMAEHVSQGMVIELVERNDLMLREFEFQKINNICSAIRRLGGDIALDDVSGSVFSQVGYTGEISRIIVFCFHDFLGPGIHGRINPEAIDIEGTPGFFRGHVHLFL